MLHTAASSLCRTRSGTAATQLLTLSHPRLPHAAQGEYDAAMGQYLETVGVLEPSYVIRRFLDAQRITCLTAYLELLHEQGLATVDHTTLLLNCYTKLKVRGPGGHGMGC